MRAFRDPDHVHMLEFRDRAAIEDQRRFVAIGEQQLDLRGFRGDKRRANRGVTRDRHDREPRTPAVRIGPPAAMQ